MTTIRERAVEAARKAVMDFAAAASEQEYQLPAIQFISNRDYLIASAAFDAVVQVLMEPSEEMLEAWADGEELTFAQIMRCKMDWQAMLKESAR